MRPKRIVRDGYDAAALRYLEWSALRPSAIRLRFLARILDLLPDRAEVLELGCGAGIPVTRALAARHRVTGVDISPVQLELARRHVATATFLEADLASVEFPPASFDAVVAFYSLIHVPRREHAGLLARIRGWLRPGGRLFATMGAGDNPDGVDEDWLGIPMFFSHFDAETNRRLVREAALEVEEADVIEEDEDGRAVSFLWVIARKPIREARRSA